MPTTITPMRDFVSLRDALDKLFEDSFIKPPMLNGGTSFPIDLYETCLLYTSPSPRDRQKSRMPSSA